jgi:hypothetical protein
MAARSAAGTAITFVEPQDRLDDSATTAGAEIPGSPQAVSVDEAIWQLDPLQREDGAPALAKGTAVQRTAPENVAEAVVHWLACYGQSPSEASRNIRELAAKAPEQVVDAALELYRTEAVGRAPAFWQACYAATAGRWRSCAIQEPLWTARSASPGL